MQCAPSAELRLAWAIILVLDNTISIVRYGAISSCHIISLAHFKNADQHDHGLTLCPADSAIFSCWNPIRSLQMGRKNCFSGWISRGFLGSERVGIQHTILRWLHKCNFDWRRRPAWKWQLSELYTVTIITRRLRRRKSGMLWRGQKQRSSS